MDVDLSTVNPMTSPVSNQEQLRCLLDVRAKAESLSRYLGSNVGDNADWPVRLNTDNDETAEELCRLLNELAESLDKIDEFEKKITVKT